MFAWYAGSVPGAKHDTACRYRCVFLPAVLGAQAATVAVCARFSIVSAMPEISTPHVIAGMPAALVYSMALRPIDLSALTLGVLAWTCFSLDLRTATDLLRPAVYETPSILVARLGQSFRVATRAQSERAVDTSLPMAIDLVAETSSSR